MSLRDNSAPVAIARWAESKPDNVFVQEADGQERTLTYSQAIGVARRWAAAFERLGVQPDEPVATIMRSDVEAVSTWLGLAWRRAYDAGIHPDYRGATLRRLLDTIRPKLVVVNGREASALSEVVGDADFVQTVLVVGTTDGGDGIEWPSHLRVLPVAQLLADVEHGPEIAPPERHDIACVVFTSGTTGPSKAVRVPWGNFWSTLPVWNDLTVDDAFYSPFPMCHAAGRSPFTWIGVPGGRWVVRNSFQTGAFWPDVNRHQCTATQLIPAMVRWIRETVSETDAASCTLKKVVTAPLTDDVMQLRKLLDLRVRTVYGMSEIGMAVSRLVTDDDLESSGRPTPGYEVRIVDEDDYDVPPGEVGELVVRTDAPWSLNGGYLNMPEQTASAWRNGWFHTGDGLRQRADGEFVFVDRLKDSLRRRGENVSSFELEAVCLAHPAVAECAVIGVKAGSDEQEIKVCVVLAGGASATAEEIVSFVADQVPAFMVPRYLELMDSLPRTDVTGRVRKHLLRDLGVTSTTWDRFAATPPAR